MKPISLALAVSLSLGLPALHCATAGAAEPAAAPGAGAKPAAATASPIPEYGKDKPIPVPQISKKTLGNGLQVWVVPRKGLPRVDYVLAVRGAGFVADASQHAGFANLMAGLLNEGTAKRDSRAVAELAQGYGGSVAAGANHDGVLVSANALASSAGPMLNLLAEVARTPSFPENEVQLAKDNALQSLKVNEATPGYRAERALTKAIYGAHPYGQTTPTVESINAVNQALLRAEHARRVRPDRSLLVITGRISSAEAIKLATAAFGDWKVGGKALPEAPLAMPAGKPARLLLERAGSVQSTLRLGAPGASAGVGDYVPLRLASTIIGGGFSSRINLNLREEKGYTYGASAGARIYRSGGGIVGGADVRNEVTGASLKEYFSEYKKLGSELVQPDEMAMNKRYVAGTYLVNNQMQAAVAGTLANNWLIGLPAEFLGQFVPMIQKVTPEQVQAIGKKYFLPEAQSIVVVGDKAAVSAQLKEYGEFVVQDK